MSSIDKLEIRGIRSFSPQRGQVIQFYKPLTVIVGPNGCGKTTIIECLKYSTTGSLPPGSKSGQTFIHDPKIASASEVQASIKLRFRDRGGKMMVVIRSFRLTQKKTKLEFKALESVLQTHDRNGQKVSLSHRCTEMDRQIPDFMGVSKAILENVIFCHQEDSNWPLQEASILKKKFDDIFESTRYTKALDTIKKERKQQNEQSKNFNRDLDVLTEQLDQAVEIKNSNATLLSTLEDENQARAELDSRVQAADREVRMLADTIADTKQLYEEIGHGEAILEEKKDRVQEAWDEIHDELEGDDEEVRQAAEQFELRIAEMRQDYEAKIAAKREFEKRREVLQRRSNVLMQRQGALDAELTQLKKQQSACDDKIEDMSRAYDARGFEGSRPVALHRIQEFTVLMETTYQESVQRLKQKRTSWAAAEEDLNNELNLKRVRVASLEESVGGKTTDLRVLESEHQDLIHKLQRLGIDGGRSERSLADLEEQIRSKESDIRLAQDSNEQQVLRDKQAAKRAEAKALERQVDELSEKLSHLNARSTEFERLRTRRGDLEERKRDLEALLARSTSQFRRVLGVRDGERLPDPGRLEALVSAVVQERKETDAATARAASDKEQDLVGKRARLKAKLELLQSSRRRIAQLEGELERLRLRIQGEGGQGLEDAPHILEKLQEREAAARENFEMVSKLRDILRRQLAKGRKRHRCPLCLHNFAEDEEAAFVRNVTTMMDTQQMKDARLKSQTKLESSRRLVAETQDQMRVWHDWKTARSQAEELSVGVSELKGTIQNIGAEVSELRERASVARRHREESEGLLPDAVQARTISESMHRLNGQITQLLRSLRLSGGSQDSDTSQDAAARKMEMSLEEVRKDYENKQRLRDQARDGADRLAKQLAQADGQSNRLRNDLTSLCEKRLKLQKEVRDRTILTERQGKLQAQIDSLSKAIERFDNEREPILRDIKSTAAELERRRRERKESEQGLQRSLDAMRRDLLGLKSLQKSLEQLNQSDPASRLKTLMAELDDTRAKVDQNFAEAGSLDGPISKLAKRLDGQHEFQRNIHDNLKFRALRNELEEMVERLDKKKATLESLPGGSTAQQDLTDARQRLVGLKEQRAHIDGRVESLQRQLKASQAQLRSSKFKDIEERHRRKLIECETTIMAVADLDKYYSALENALQRYHQLKISEINSIIRDLWRLTYRGQDIENIEIKSDRATTGKARSYNYRVVMTKGATELDMRGRCSAGQKVLVSLVVRLALAETFCVNCGILALDEPTTNLDEANKNGFAQALSDIINERRSQENFQLVVITHDEEFVKMLGQAQMAGGTNPGHYYRVSREELDAGQFYSRIDRQDWEG